MLSDFYKSEEVPLKEAFGKAYPDYFVHPALEYRALVRFCGVIDLTHWHVLRVRGSDRATFLNAMVTNDVASLASGCGCHSAMTTVKGKIISELFVFARKDEHLVAVSQGGCRETVSVFEKHIVSGDVVIDDLSSERGVLAVEGSKAKDVVERLLGTGPLPKSSLDGVEREVEDFTVFVTRNSVTGEPGYHVMVPSTEVLRVRNFLVQAARGSDGMPVGLVAWNIRRAENGLPWYGIDFSGDNFPQEARLDHTVSYTKGCFRGQETLARLQHQGHVNRFWVGLVPRGDGFPEGRGLPADVAERLPEIIALDERTSEVEFSRRAPHDAKALDLRGTFPAGLPLYAPADAAAGTGSSGQKPVGSLTSAVYSFPLRAPLFLACVRREYADVGTRLFIDTSRGRLELKQITLPLRAG